jgi:hypothetical protein
MKNKTEVNDLLAKIRPRFNGRTYDLFEGYLLNFISTVELDPDNFEPYTRESWEEYTKTIFNVDDDRGPILYATNFVYSKYQGVFGALEFIKNFEDENGWYLLGVRDDSSIVILSNPYDVARATIYGMGLQFFWELLNI